MINISAIYQGKLSTLDEIRVSPMSRAYTFSDSIYEVIPYFLGKPLCFKEHFDRMTESVNQMNMDVDFKSVSDTVGYITPVPVGVGPMTISMLLKNTLKACQFSD